MSSVTEVQAGRKLTDWGQAVEVSRFLGLDVMAVYDYAAAPKVEAEWEPDPLPNPSEEEIEAMCQAEEMREAAALGAGIPRSYYGW